MLSTNSASRTSRSCSREILGAINRSNSKPSSRRGVTSFLAQKPRDTCCNHFQFFQSKSINPKNSLRGHDPQRRRLISTSAAAANDTVGPNRKDEVYGLIDNINRNETEIIELLEDLDLLDEHIGALSPDPSELDNAFSQTVGHRSEEVLEERVRMARQRFGDILPENYLNATEIQLYSRLYGEPIIQEEEENETEKAYEELESDQLFREDGQGGWEEVRFERDIGEVEEEDQDDDIRTVYDMEAEPVEEETITMKRSREVASQLDDQLVLEQLQEETVPDSSFRRHPLTLRGKFSTDPRTIFLPKENVARPISDILANYANKHIKEKAVDVFGGSFLPYSTSVAPPWTQTPQFPIPLDASQYSMSEMEGNVYLAVLYPGIYSSVLSALTEIRRRLGSEWLRRLISQKGGPNVLDVGGGGAGILAWRDVLRAEFELMHPEAQGRYDAEFGRSTVVAGSKVLQSRAAAILENTTFLPRLPDYVHVRDAPTLDDSRAPPKRKQYDVIIAPHSLLGIEEEYLRKEYVENLWSLLNADGGVLVLLEKGIPRGFEAIAQARNLLLKRHISSSDSAEYMDDSAVSSFASDNVDVVRKEPGMIIAPCMNHGKCPMDRFSSSPKNREDFCHFSQRYVRPQFLQRIIGAKDFNHEDVKFSYLAVQRGVDLRQELGIQQGTQATEAAFDGYEYLIPKDENEKTPEVATTPNDEPGTTTTVEEAPTSEDPTKVDFRTLALPRIIYPPLKRRGHIILDVCTPEAKIERWTVPRSYGKVPYTDARKAQWGDLWALGAKTRVPRNLRLGNKNVESKKERLARRDAQRAAMSGEEGDEDNDDDIGGHEMSGREKYLLDKKNGQTIPKWKKKMSKRKEKLASRAQR